MAKIFVSYTIVSTSTFFLVAREKDNPLSIVYQSEPLPPPHTLRNVTIDNLDPVVYQVELWTTLDSVTLNQLRGRCDIDASQYTQIAFQPLQFVVDLGRGEPHYDPSDGETVYTINPYLAGLTAEQYLVFKPGAGPLDWGTQIQIHNDVNGLSDGFEFVNGQSFASGEEYTILINRLTTQQVSGSTTSFPVDVIELLTSDVMTSAHYNKVISVRPTENVLFAIPDLSAIPERTKFTITTHDYNPAGPFWNLALKMFNGDYCKVDGDSKEIVYIGRGEEYTFMKKGARLHLINSSGDRHRVGEKIYREDALPVNAVELSGTWVAQTLYQRLFNEYVLQLPPGEWISVPDDTVMTGENRLKWAYGATKLWIPDHRGLFYRSSDPTGNYDPDSRSASNVYQADSNKNHNHYTNSAYNKLSARASDIDNGGTTGSVDSTGATTEYRIAVMDAGKWAQATLQNEGGAEARPKNISQKVYVVI